MKLSSRPLISLRDQANHKNRLQGTLWQMQELVSTFSKDKTWTSVPIQKLPYQ